MKKRLGLWSLTFISILFSTFQSFGAVNFGKETLGPKLKEGADRAGQAAVTLAADPQDANARAQLQTALGEGNQVTQIRKTDNGVEATVATPGGETVVLIPIVEGVAQPAVVGREAIDALAQARPPEPAGGAFTGEHDPAALDRVRTLRDRVPPVSLADYFAGKGEEGQRQLSLVRAALAKILRASLDTERLKRVLLARGVPADRIDAVVTAVMARYANIDDAVERILKETQILNDDQNRFLLAFLTNPAGSSVAYYEQKFLEASLAQPEHVAHHLTHEDVEDALGQALRNSGVTEGKVHPHDVITDVQTELAGPSVAGRVNALHDAALAYRLGLDESAQGVYRFSNDLDRANARQVRAYRSLPNDVQAEIARVMTETSADEVGVVVEVNDAGVTVGGITLSGALVEGVRALVGTSGKVFLNAPMLREGATRKGVEFTPENLRAFLLRAALTAQISNSKDGKLETALSAAKVQSGQDLAGDPRVAIIDVDAIAPGINYAAFLNADGSLNEEGMLEMTGAVAGVARAIAQKIAQIQAQRGDITFVVASHRLPQALLDYILQAMDATAEGRPVAIAFKKVEDLIAQVAARVNAGRKADQAQFQATASNVLFYVSEANTEAYRASEFPKVLTVKKAQAGERVSIALLMVGVEWLYVDDRAAALARLKDIYLEVVRDLKARGDLTDDEAQLLEREADSLSGGVIPAVKILDPQAAIQGIYDSMRTAVAVRRFA